MAHKKTRILIISDTHEQRLHSESSYEPFRRPLPKADILLHCGDLTMQGGLDAYEQQIQMMAEIDAELKLVIAGNHDLSLDPKWWSGNPNERPLKDASIPDRAIALWKGEKARAAGITYLDEGLHRFKLSSGVAFSVYATPYQPEFYNWAFPYRRDQDRYNVGGFVAEGVECITENPIPDAPEVDIIMSHGPPYGHLDTIYNGSFVGCKALMTALARSKPRLHSFGHIHEGWGAQLLDWDGAWTGNGESVSNTTVLAQSGDEKKMDDRAIHIDISSDSSNPLCFGKSSLLVNAAIMDVGYKPVQAPFVVDLDLPISL